MNEERLIDWLILTAYQATVVYLMRRGLGIMFPSITNNF